MVSGWEQPGLGRRGTWRVPSAQRAVAGVQTVESAHCGISIVRIGARAVREVQRGREVSGVARRGARLGVTVTSGLTSAKIRGLLSPPAATESQACAPVCPWSWIWPWKRAPSSPGQSTVECPDSPHLSTWPRTQRGAPLPRGEHLGPRSASQGPRLNLTAWARTPRAWGTLRRVQTPHAQHAAAAALVTAAWQRVRVHALAASHIRRPARRPSQPPTPRPPQRL